MLEAQFSVDVCHDLFSVFNDLGGSLPDGMFGWILTAREFKCGSDFHSLISNNRQFLAQQILGSCCPNPSGLLVCS